MLRRTIDKIMSDTEKADEIYEAKLHGFIVLMFHEDIESGTTTITYCMDGRSAYEKN